ncbi:MAG: hypothetical protein ACQKBU_11850, partial [Verrucomicrobiales bacterium]
MLTDSDAGSRLLAAEEFPTSWRFQGFLVDTSHFLNGGKIVIVRNEIALGRTFEVDLFARSFAGGLGFRFFSVLLAFLLGGAAP